MIKKFSFEDTKINGLIKIQPFVAVDKRGRFIKDFNESLFLKNGDGLQLKEVFYTISYKGVIRALHFQRERQQTKLVRCVKGRIWDVVVDLRPSSPTFKMWQAFELNDENNFELFIPSGCAHGYLVLEDSIVSYKCGEEFYSEFDDGIRWNDPDIGVKWPLDLIGGEAKVILSEKDETLQSFNEFMNKFGGLK